MMEVQLTPKDRKKIETGVRGKYAKVSHGPEGLFRYPTGRAALEALNYDTELLQVLPGEVVSSYCGVGNPFTLGPIREGESVLDVGCGAGIDTIIAAMKVGPTGTATGIDMVPEMFERARKNLRMTGFGNVTFLEASAEKTTFPDAAFDAVISNGVFNLVIDKARALEEVLRVLRPGGRLMMADQVLIGEPPSKTKTRVKNWFR